MNLYYKEIGTPFGHRQARMISGIGNAEVKPSVGYELTLRATGLYADEGIRNQDDFLYLNPTPSSVLNREQNVITPMADGNVDLIWTKLVNRAAISKWNKMKAVIQANKTANLEINYDTIDLVGISSSTGNKYSCGILLPDSRILCIPYNASQFAIFDPSDYSLATFGAPDTLSGKYNSGVLLPDGKVVAIPNNEEQPALVDPINQTITKFGQIDDKTSKYSSGILLPDGRIYCTPYLQRYGAIIDPIKHIITVLTYSLPNTVSSGVLLPDGKVFHVPLSLTSWQFFDPATSTFSTFGPIDTTSTKYSSGHLLDDDRVLCFPNAKSSAEIMDFKLQISTSIPGVNSNKSSVLLPDGNIMGIYFSNSFNIINPTKLTVRSFGNSYGSNAFSHGVLLPDGRIVCISYNNSQFAIVSASDGNYGVLPDLDTCLSAYLNKF